MWVLTQPGLVVRDGASRLLTMRVWLRAARSDLTLRSGRRPRLEGCAAQRVPPYACNLAAASRPSLALAGPSKEGGRRESRMHDRTRSLVCKIEGRKHTSEYRYAETFRPSLRNGLRLIARSPRCPGLIATVARGLTASELDPSVGRSGPHAFAVRFPRRSSSDLEASIATRTQRP